MPEQQLPEPRVNTVQGGLFVAIGLGILFLAVTGRLKRLNEAWNFVWSGTGQMPPGGLAPTGSDFTPAPSKRQSISSTFVPGLPGPLARAFA